MTAVNYFGDELPSQVFLDKYALRDRENNLLEDNPDQMHRRMAKEFARIEKTKFSSPMSEDFIYGLFKDFKYIIPQGSPMAGIGSDGYVSLSNCYAIPSVIDSYGGIHCSDEYLSQISKRRGGVGVDVSNIRPANMVTTNAARLASGVVSYCERFSNTIREVGQCIAAGQLVLTDSGLKPIESIVAGHDKVWTRKGFVPVDNILRNGKKKVVRLTTNRGFSLVATTNHVVVDENANEIQIGELSIGDRICLIPGGGFAKSERVRLICHGPEFEQESSYYNTLELPKEIDRKFAYLLGYFYGNGHVESDEKGPDGISIACGHEYREIKNRICRYFTSLFGKEPSVNNGCGKVYRIRVASKHLTQFLQNNGLLKEKAADIVFPQAIKDSPLEEQLAFISGFFDADGSIRSLKGGYKIASTSHDFLKEIQSVLMAAGICSGIRVEKRERKGWNDLYTLYVVGAASQRRIRSALAMSKRIKRRPLAAVRDSILTPYTASNLGVSHSQYDFVPTGKQKVSLNCYEQIGERVQLKNPIVLDSIVSIEDAGEAETYDIQLPEEHLFYCGGFLVHNSGRRGALMLTISVHHPEVVDFTTMKMDPTKVTGANVSVRLTDEFLQAVKDDKDYEQRWPVEGEPKFKRMVSAREVWKKIIHCAWARAEPGLLFWDNIIKNSPADCYKENGFNTVVTNPCCFSTYGNYYVLTRDGIKEIKQVTSQDEVWVDDAKVWAKTSGYFNAGVAPVYRVTLKNGEQFDVTANHKFMTCKGKRNGTKVEFVPGELVELKNLSVGDKILLSFNEAEGFRFGKSGTYEEGLIWGWLCGDGCLSYMSEAQSHPTAILDFWEKEHDVAEKIHAAALSVGFDVGLQSVKENNKRSIKTTDFSESFIEKYQYNIWNFKSETERVQFLDIASKEFIIGYISAYFAADGTVQCNHQTKYYGLSLASTNKNRLKQIKYILAIFGVKSTVCLLRKAGITYIKGKDFNVKECWRLVITGIDNISQFAKYFSAISESKQKRIDEIVSLTQQKGAKLQRYSEIISVEPVGEAPVGCIEVPKYHRFSVSGIVSGNSEIPLCGFDSCRLLLLNLFGFVDNPFTPEAQFNWSKFYHYGKLAQRLMDDLVDLEMECINRILAKVKSDPEPDHIKTRELELWENIKVKCRDGRRTGTGITALGDAIAGVGIAYGSDKSIGFTERIYKTLKFSAYESSVDMAKELGAFPVWDHELEKDCAFLLRFKGDCVDLGEKIVFGDQIYDDMAKHGRRNIALLTTAPAGSVSILAGPGPYYGTTSGIEPLFIDAPYTRRKKIVPGMDCKVDFVDDLGDKWTEYEVYHSKIKMWMDITGETDYRKSPYHGCTANDIDWPQRVRLQAAATLHLDHSVSSTLNLPKAVSHEKVAEIYETAWESGCKGITVYRDGCRDGVLVTNKEKDVRKIPKTDAPKRPTSLPCETHLVSTKGEKYFVIVGLLDGQPYEVMAGRNELTRVDKGIGKLKKISRGNYKLVLDDESIVENVTDHIENEQEAITRLVSASLRHGADINFIVHQLEKTRGDMHGFAKVLARTLKKYIKDGEKVHGECCDQCGSDLLIRQEGCVTCRGCGWSKCN